MDTDAVQVIGFWVMAALCAVITAFFVQSSADREVNKRPTPWVLGYVVFLVATGLSAGIALSVTLNHDDLVQALLWIFWGGLAMAVLFAVLSLVRRRIDFVLWLFAMFVVALSAAVWRELLR